MQITATTVGYMAAIVGTSMMLPQVIKSWKTKRVGDLAMGTVIIYFVNCGLWLTYGVLISSRPVVLANGIGLMIGFLQLVIKIKYNDKSKRLFSNRQQGGGLSAD